MTNVGAQLASGEFLGFLDHDDMLELDALEKMKPVVYNVDTFIGYIAKFTDGDEKISREFEKMKKTILANKEYNTLLNDIIENNYSFESLRTIKI